MNLLKDFVLPIAIASITGLLASLPGLITALRMRRVEEAITSNTEHINSRMDKMIGLVGDEALARGKLEGKAEEKANPSGP